MTIGEKIKEYRKLNNISQTDLASLIGVNVSFLCKIEKNEKKVSYDKLMMICNILNINFKDLKILYFSEKIESILIDEDNDFKSFLLKKILNNICHNDKSND